MNDSTSTYEPVVVVVRHPDYPTDVTTHYIAPRVVEIDLGGAFDITYMRTGDEEAVREYAAQLREEVADLPADHTARAAVEEAARDLLEMVGPEVTA